MLFESRVQLVESRKDKHLLDLQIPLRNETVFGQTSILASGIPSLRSRRNERLQCKRQTDLECAGAIVLYAYTRELKVKTNYVVRNLSFTSNLEMGKVFSFCSDFVLTRFRLSLESLPKVRNLLSDEMISSLKSVCCFLMQKKFETIVSTNILLNPKYEQLFALISQDYLKVENEQVVFGAIGMWIGKHYETRSDKLTDLKRCIRWRQTGEAFQTNVVYNNDIVGKYISCVKYLLKFEKQIALPHKCFNPKPKNGLLNKFLVFGQPSFDKFMWIASRFDPVTMHNSNLAFLTYRNQATIVLLGNGETVIVGGMVADEVSASVELFVNSQSRSVSPLNVARYEHGACAVGDAVVVCGGLGHRGVLLNSCEFYSRSEGRWIMLPEMREKRYFVAVVSVDDKRVFAIGGRNDKCENTSSVEVCRLPDDFASSPLTTAVFWRSLAPMREARCSPAAALFKNNILVAGGYRIFEANLSSVEMFPIDTDNGQWISLSLNMNEKRAFFSLLVSNNELFAIGNMHYPYNSVERLQLRESQNSEMWTSAEAILNGENSARWESLSPLPSMVKIQGAVLLPKDLFVNF